MDLPGHNSFSLLNCWLRQVRGEADGGPKWNSLSVNGKVRVLLAHPVLWCSWLCPEWSCPYSKRCPQSQMPQVKKEESPCLPAIFKKKEGPMPESLVGKRNGSMEGICPPPLQISYVEALTPNEMVLGGGAFGRWLGDPRDGIGARKRRGRETPQACTHENTARKQLSTGPERTKFASCLILYFQESWNHDK